MAFNIRRRAFLYGATAAAAAQAAGTWTAGTAHAAPGSEGVDLGVGKLAEVLGGARDLLQVRLAETGQELALPTRGFAAKWEFKPGDLVVVQPEPTSTSSSAQAFVEPLTHVIEIGDHMEVWATNLMEGPRLGAVFAARG